MNEEARESRSIKIKPSILRNAHHAAIEGSKSLGRWLENAIGEKIAREKGRKGSQNRKDLRQQVFSRE